MTRPSVTRSSAAHASERSYSGAGWLPFSARLVIAESLRCGCECLAAVLVVAEHVEARARGREQHGVAGARDLGSARNRGFEIFRRFHGNFRIDERALDERGVPADQEHVPCLVLHYGTQRREILA